MPDLALRLGQHCLTLSPSLEYRFEQLGFNPRRETGMLNLLEPETISNVYAQALLSHPSGLCVYTPYLLRSALAHERLESRQAEVVRAALKLAQEQRPQQLIVEAYPSELPLDPSSAASLKAYKGEYLDLIRIASEQAIDGVLLSRFSRTIELKAALMGARCVTDVPVLASITEEADKFDVLAELPNLIELGLSAFGLRLQVSDSLDIKALTQVAYELRTTGESQGQVHPHMRERVGHAREQFGFVHELRNAYPKLPLLLEFEFVEARGSEELTQAERKQRAQSSVSELDFLDLVSELMSSGIQIMRIAGKVHPACVAVLACGFQDLPVLVQDIQEQQWQ